MMGRIRFLMILGILFGSLSIGNNCVFANGLIIGNGSTFTLNDATLDLNGLDLTIEDGGTLNLGSGTIVGCGVLTVRSGGNIIWGTGKIYYSQSGGDNGRGDNGGGCFITVAAYGSPIDPHVNVLREFRNRFLLVSPLGKRFARFYYTYSAPVADFVSNHDSLRTIVRVSLLPVVGLSWVTLKINPIPPLICMLLIGSGFIGIVAFIWKVKEQSTNHDKSLKAE
jgi:hypothetical protein